MTERNVIGCMTGTSMDAIDVALVTMHGEGLCLRAFVRRCLSYPLGALSQPLREFAAGEPASAAQIVRLADGLAHRHVAALRTLIRNEPVDLIAVHGQTVLHAPPLSWQLLSPAPIAEAFGTPVVCDFRAADLAAGGQGAPITPLADYVLFRDASETRAVINLGGFANYTLLPRQQAGAAASQNDAVNGIRGADICVCNQLLDAVARNLFGEMLDQHGQHAAEGQVHSGLRDSLVRLLRGQANEGRSLGTGDELGDWIEQHRAGHRAEDLARSTCEALAMTIAGVVNDTVQSVGLDGINRILVGGGGVKNRVLFDAMKRYAKAITQPTDAFGVPASHREAAAMAVLGVLCQDAVPITLPQVTGARDSAPVAGSWTIPDRRSTVD